MYKKRLGIGRSSSSSPFLYSQMSSQKAQVTVFIILGLILLLAVVLVVLLKKEVVTFKPSEIIPTEKGKVERFMEACMDQIGSQAISKIGLQGGYINVPSDIALDGSQHLRTSEFTVVPYWAYGTNLAIPSLEHIKQDLDQDMEANLRLCLLNTAAFKEAYDLQEKSDLTANTQIVDSKVIFKVHWDVEIRNKAGEVVTEVINHVIESPIKLKKVYETARRIVEKEMTDTKLEDITQDLIALEHPDVPVAGLEVACRERKWKIGEVKSGVQHLLRTNIGELKVKGTNYVEFPEELPYYQNHYVWNVGEDMVNPDIGVVFHYDESYPFAFDVTPRSGTILKSNQLGGNNYLLRAFCVQTWKFVYDVSYPVLVTVRDETTGYTFKMALTVHLVNNIPHRGTPAAGRGAVFLDTYPDEEFCAGANVPMTIFSSKLVSNEYSGVYDKQPLDGVNITFTCLKYSCDSGTTSYNFAGMGNVAAYHTIFPYCVGGIMRGSKSGFKDDWKRVVTEAGKEVQLELAPLYAFPVKGITIFKHELTGQQVDKAVPLGDDDTALITLTYQKKDQMGTTPFHEASVVKSGALDAAVGEQQQLDLLADADFTYIVDVKVLRGETMIGGYQGNWSVPWDQLHIANTIVFHVPVREKGSDDDRTELLLGLDEFSRYVPPPELMR